MKATLRMNIIIVTGLTWAMLFSLSSCTRKSLDEIQEMLIDDTFFYSYGPSTYSENAEYGTKHTYEELSLLEFKEDSTFFIGHTEKYRFYDNNELIYYLGNINTTYDKTEKIYGTFQLKYDEDNKNEIVVILNITLKNYETYDGTATVESKEECSESEEYTIYMDDTLIKGVGPYPSLNYAGQRMVDAANDVS